MSADFRRGFLQGLAENGIVPSELEDCLEKIAMTKNATIQAVAPAAAMGAGAGAGAGASSSFLSKLVGAAKTISIDAPLAAAVGGGGVLGLLGGYGLHALTGGDSVENKVKDYQDQLIQDELRFQIRKLKRMQGLDDSEDI